MAISCEVETCDAGYDGDQKKYNYHAELKCATVRELEMEFCSEQMSSYSL
jgi:hypothetical protein